jgi:hypothetical protein
MQFFNPPFTSLLLDPKHPALKHPTSLFFPKGKRPHNSHSYHPDRSMFSLITDIDNQHSWVIMSISLEILVHQIHKFKLISQKKVFSIIGASDKETNVLDKSIKKCC